MKKLRVLAEQAKKEVEAQTNYIEFMQDEVELEESLEGCIDYLRTISALKKVTRGEWEGRRRAGRGSSMPMPSSS